MCFNQNPKEEYTTPNVRVRDIRVEFGLCVSPTVENEGFQEDNEYTW